MPTIRSADPVDPPGPAPVEPAPWLPSPVPAPPQLTATVEPSIAEPALVTPPIAEPAPPVAAAAIPPVAPLPRDPPKPEQPFAQPLIKADTRYPDVTVLPIAPAVSSESFATLQLR